MHLIIYTVFSDNEIPKDRNHYTCIVAILLILSCKQIKETMLKFIQNSANIKKEEASRFY